MATLILQIVATAVVVLTLLGIGEDYSKLPDSQTNKGALAVGLMLGFTAVLAAIWRAF